MSTHSPFDIPLPARPIFLGRLSYEAMVEGDGPRELQREEEPFWARLSGLLFDGFRNDVLNGRYFSALGRSALPALPPTPIVSEAATNPAEVTGPEVALGSGRVPSQFIPLRALSLPRDVPVTVTRSNGELDDTWTLRGRSPSGQALVTRESPQGTLSKLLSVEEVLILNMHLLPEGLAVKVPRSSGAVDEGWITRGVRDGAVLVDKPGVGRKKISAEQFFPFNHELLGIDRPDLLPEIKPRAVDVEPGMVVRVMRSGGEMEDGWIVITQDDEGALHVEKESVRGLLKKRLPLHQALRDNPQLLPLGVPVRVRSEEGLLEDGWFVMGLEGYAILVEKPLVGSRYLDADELIEANRDRLLAEGQGPTVLPGEEAIAQRWLFAHENRLVGWVWDGFADGGRDLQLDSSGWPQQARREILVVDRLGDFTLRKHLAFARELMAKPSIERVDELVRFVQDQLGGPVHRIEGRVALACASRAGQVVHIGEAARALGGGVARHRALLFHILAEEAGLQPTLVRGFAGITVDAAHAWCEMELGGQQVLVDLCRPFEQAYLALGDAHTQQFYRQGGPA